MVSPRIRRTAVTITSLLGGWLLLTAARAVQLASGDAAPVQHIELTQAFAYIAVGASATLWLIKQVKELGNDRSRNGDSDEVLVRSRSIEGAVNTFVAEIRNQTALLTALVRQGEETARYQMAGRVAIEQINDLHGGQK